MKHLQVVPGLSAVVVLGVFSAGTAYAAGTLSPSPSGGSSLVTQLSTSVSGVVTGQVSSVSNSSAVATVALASPAAKGNVVVNSQTGAFTYTPTPAARHAAAASGASVAATQDAFTVTVTDGYGGSTSVPVTVPISPQNVPPTVKAVAVKLPRPVTGVVSGSVSGLDSDGDPLTYNASAAAAKGNVSINASTGTFTYTPTASARRAAAVAQPGSPAKAASFTVAVTDGHGGSVAVPVHVKVGS